MVILANANNTTDGAAYNFLSQINSPIPIVLVSWAEDFKFNEELLKLGRYVLIDFVEFGWDARPDQMFLFGSGIEPDSKFYKDEWIIFDKFVWEHKPVVHFKRELLRNLASELSSFFLTINFYSSCL